MMNSLTSLGCFYFTRFFDEKMLHLVFFLCLLFLQLPALNKALNMVSQSRKDNHLYSWTRGGRICKCITHSDELCKLLADSLESLNTSFFKTSKVESGHFGSCVSLL